MDALTAMDFSRKLPRTADVSSLASSDDYGEGEQGKGCCGRRPSDEEQPTREKADDESEEDRPEPGEFHWREIASQKPEDAGGSKEGKNRGPVVVRKARRCPLVGGGDGTDQEEKRPTDQLPCLCDQLEAEKNPPDGGRGKGRMGCNQQQEPEAAQRHYVEVEMFHQPSSENRESREGRVFLIIRIAE
jgi:hypothetical protein